MQRGRWPVRERRGKSAVSGGGSAAVRAWGVDMGAGMCVVHAKGYSRMICDERFETSIVQQESRNLRRMLPRVFTLPVSFAVTY